MATNVMNIAVSITALFSGIFIVVVGGLADRVGRVKILMWGFVLGIVGSLLVGIAPPGSLAVPLLMLGRIFQGLSAAFIMPASLALIKAYWDGAGRQRAVSLWSMSIMLTVPAGRTGGDARQRPTKNSRKRLALW
jgi:DHA2 family multidrug resistance protein-like MFS transporter